MLPVIPHTIPVNLVFEFGFFGVFVPHIEFLGFFLVVCAECFNILLGLVEYVLLQPSQLFLVESNQLHLLSHFWLSRVALGQLGRGQIDATDGFADIKERGASRIGMVHLAETLIPLLRKMRQSVRKAL